MKKKIKDALKKRASWSEQRSKRREKWAARFQGLSLEERVALVKPHGEPTEFEVQAYVYSELQRMGWAVRGELSPKTLNCRFDIVVFDKHGRAIRIIELKKRKSVDALDQDNRTLQIEKYSQFGIPVTTIKGMSEARHFISRCTPESLPPATVNPVIHVERSGHAEAMAQRPVPVERPSAGVPMVKLTRAMIFAGASGSAGFSSRQKSLLGAGLATKGWIKRLIGSEIPEADYQQFLALKPAK
jgi:hypothetical protein